MRRSDGGDRLLTCFPPFHSVTMVKVLFYGYADGLFSSEKHSLVRRVWYNAPPPTKLRAARVNTRLKITKASAFTRPNSRGQFKPYSNALGRF